jgi:hypothetical protein
MAQEPLAKKIVTLNSLPTPPKPQPGGLESMTEARESAGQKLDQARYYQMMERLRQETKTAGSNVMITAQDREVSRLQSAMAEQAEADRKLAAGALEVKFGTGFGGGDWFGWLRSMLDWVDRREAHPLVRPSSTAREALPDPAKLALCADWGTALYGAPKIAASIKAAAPFNVLMHLGDVYYSGTEKEVQQRFLDAWPRSAGHVSRTLNSNHEMYSGGFGYFKLALPALGQASSYFAMENAHWLLVGLDTAYVDHDMDTQQVAWLNLVIDEVKHANGGKAKKLVLFSHQQPYSRLDNQGPKLQQALKHLLDAKAITAWYWGHEHQCVIYDKHPQWGLLGRCLGHGGIPEPRKREVKEARTEKKVGPIEWKRMDATPESPGALILDGPNPDIPGEEDNFVPHGYMTIELQGPKLIERAFLANGTEIFSNTIE